MQPRTYVRRSPVVDDRAPSHRDRFVLSACFVVVSSTTRECRPIARNRETSSGRGTLSWPSEYRPEEFVEKFGDSQEIPRNFYRDDGRTFGFASIERLTFDRKDT